MESKAKLILIIEEDPFFSELLKEKIEGIDFQVRIIHTAAEGLNWMNENIPYLFILDYNLRDMNGKDYILKLKTRNRPLPPFIISSKQNNAQIAVDMMKLGAKDFIIKESNFVETIHFAVKHIIQEIEYENRLKRTDVAVAESYLFNKQIIERTEAGIIVYDQDLRYVVWNPYMERMTGFKASHVIGKSPFDIFPFLNNLGAREYMNKALKGIIVHSPDYQYEVPENGKTGWANDTSAPLYDAEGNIIGVITTLHDITERKAAEEALILSKNRLRQIIDLVPHYIYAKDTDGNFILANKAVAELYRMPVKKIIGLTDSIFSDSNKPKTDNRYCENEKLISEETIIDSNGNKQILETTQIPYKAIKEKTLAKLHISIDITKRKEDDVLIRKLSEAVKQSHNGIIISDFNGIIEYSNPRFSEITGFSTEDVKGQNLRILNSEVQSDEYYNGIWKTLVTGNSWKGEFYSITKSGHYILEQVTVSPIENEIGEIINYLVILQDITVSKENEIRLNTLISNIPDAILFKDGEKRWLEANKAAVKLLNLEGFDFRGKTASELVAYSKIYKEVLNSADLSDETAFISKESFTTELLFHSENEKDKTYEFTKVPLFYSNGSRKGLVIIGRDITERINKENELILAKEKAVQNDRLKTAFLQNISHEIRTPMNAIIGFSKMLELPDISPEKLKNFTTIINTNANQLLSVVSNVLTISSLETQQESIFERKVNINGIMSNLITAYKPHSIDNSINFYVDNKLSDEQSEIFTDKTKVTQILNNLINNAFKFTNNGTIEFGCQIIPSANGQTLNELLFFVKDTGIGIDEQWLDKIFDRFVQSDLSENRKYGGNGIGLSISKGFVELLGGKIWVESTKGKGSIFYFSIPYKPVNRPNTYNYLNDQSNTNRRILVAEDVDVNYILIEEILKDLNYTLIHAKDGNEAVEICKANTDIQLILMDIKMPVMDGYSAAKLIREFRPGIPIIAQSAYALDSEIINYSDAFNDYITKPINSDELKTAINKFIH
jgi:PAS domain S-box-containing protein